MLRLRWIVPLAFFISLATRGGLPGAARPNVLVVMTDDQGYGDLSCHGNPVLKTPNLDRLHDRSVRFTDFHVAPMCTPTRGQLLTGRDALDNGATFVCLGRSMVRRAVPTLPEMLRRAGYRTALFGKWHLGDSYPHRPLDRGFEKVVRHGAWGITSIPDYFPNDYFDDTYYTDGKPVKYRGYCTDVWFEEAMTWMAEKGEAGEPFFAYLATNVPHSPHWVKDHYSDPYRGRGPAKFFGMIANLDENMGRLETFLEEKGLRENTILVFLTDNGTAAGEKVFNAGMRGKKRSLYEGGHRVPLFVRWPAGGLGDPRDIDTLAHVQDLAPTLLDLLGIETPEDASFDGTSLAALLRGSRSGLPDPDRKLVIQYQHAPRKWDAAVLWKTWRLVHGEELYQIDRDPGQETDIAGEHPGIVTALRAHYESWWREVQAPLAEPRSIDLGSDQANPTTLYSSDWLGSYADNSYNLRQGNHVGWWNVIVTRPGTYEFTLSRWPFEAKAALDASLVLPEGGAGRAVPIREARLAIGKHDLRKPAPPGTKSVSFTVGLEPGKQILRSWFHDADGKPLCSAYYLRVERKS